jgi:LCP family protein required for cell wall assembly
LCFTAGFIYIFNTNLGSGEEMAELDKALPNQVKNVVVLGTDKSGLHADVIMVFSLSTKKGTINCTSILRDTRVNYKGSHIKITEAMAYGGESAVVQAIKDITGLQIHDYVVFNFNAVKDVIDAVDGVDFFVPQNMFYEDPEQDLYINLRKGQQLLNGDKALQLLRFRSYPMGDIARTETQRDFMEAVFEQNANAKYIGSVPKIYSAINNNIKSSLSLAEIVDYAELVLKMDNPTFNTIELPYDLVTPFVVYNREEVSKIFSEKFN